MIKFYNIFKNFKLCSLWVGVLCLLLPQACSSWNYSCCTSGDTTSQASSSRLHYFLFNVRCSKCSCPL